MTIHQVISEAITITRILVFTAVAIPTLLIGLVIFRLVRVNVKITSIIKISLYISFSFFISGGVGGFFYLYSVTNSPKLTSISVGIGMTFILLLIFAKHTPPPKIRTPSPRKTDTIILDQYDQTTGRYRKRRY